ncbi:MAG: DUF748 domain-containing protein, partial [Cyclobacteriaceae bacterium]|nr:DUF748 domain-containing protein [Cyclobacteriaceae bacterium]
LLLENVKIGTLLKNNRLILRKMHIIEPEIVLNLNGKRHIMLPYSSKSSEVAQAKNAKRPIESFLLAEFILRDASFQSTNSRAERQFTIGDVDISFSDLSLDSDSLSYDFSISQARLSIGSISGDLQKGPIKHVSFSDFRIGIDSVTFHYSLDSLMYRFYNFTTALRDLDVQTADSTYHVVMKSFDLSYRDQSLDMKEVSFKPNVSQSVLQRAYHYQHTEFSGSVGSLRLNEVNFDSILYAGKLFIDEVAIENVKASLYKDRTKPFDSTRYPVYLGQTIRGIKMPLSIRKVNATNVELKNTERKPDSTEATVIISKARLTAENITNLAPNQSLVMHADAYLLGKVRFNASLSFRYDKPAFHFEGRLASFNMPDLNPLIGAYTPAKINSGTADEISFSGIAEQSSASGTMKFLYHDLAVDLQLQQKAKWKSGVLAFAANTALNNSNPVSESTPPRIVTFSAERDRNKGFVNLIIKSVLAGMKETMIMSKENRQTYKETKREAKREGRN